MAFDSATLVQLYQLHLCPYAGQVHMGGTLRSGRGWCRQGTPAVL